MSSLNGDSKYQSQVDIDLDKDVAVLPFSSGTTGVPKGVMLSQKNLVDYICSPYVILFWSDMISYQFKLRSTPSKLVFIFATKTLPR